jgi:adenine-specific DNA-methyltransferase
VTAATECFAKVNESNAATLDSVACLRHVPRLSCGERATGNAIIRGENLSVLRALLPTWEAAVRCIYIDPPYNNGETYTHYADDFGPEQWLSDIRARLEALAPLLRRDGSIWISIDDRQVHYLKVEADRIFGRHNFVATVVWQQRATRENRRALSPNHEYVLVYSKELKQFTLSCNRVPANPDLLQRYKNPDNDPRGPWQSISANVQAGHATSSQFYTLRAPGGKLHTPPKGRCWVYTKEKMDRAIHQNDVWFGHNGSGVPRLKRFLSESAGTVVPSTLWTSAEVGTTLQAKKHLLRLFPSANVFDTPKPESLIHRILAIATDPGDLVLDAYLGSGTTAAVAHKSSRRYIGIEEGSQAVTHCADRLRQVIEGEEGGISTEIGWRGGGGFDFFEHASG